MSAAPIDVVLARLADCRLSETGRDRWRACCPAHGGRNRSALSIGVGAEGQVLLKCWHGCEVEQVAHALGLELEDLFPPRESSAGRPARRRLISAGQALELLDSEMHLAVVACAQLAEGEPLDDDTRERLLLGAARVATLRDEVHA